MEYREFLKRFWAKVERTDWCWLWTGALDGDGYGRIKVEGQSVKAHRIAYELVNGPRPAEVLVLHRCDNPRCVRPDHLFEGDHQANMRDAVSKGRMRGNQRVRGPRPLGPRGGQPFDKLPPNQVEAIRSRYAEGKVLQRELADEFGISPSYVSELLGGKYRAGGGAPEQLS